FAVLLSGSTSFGQNQASTAPPTNDGIVHHMEELEDQVKELRAEVAALKDNDKPATAATATASVTAVPQNNLVSSPVTGAAPAAPSLAGLLGPTSLSGFVDLYYNQNFNNPASQTNGLRFFDQSTQMFGLNMVELVVDKTPEVTN